MTLKEIQKKLYENLTKHGWGSKLKMFLLSEEFTSILRYLYDESQEGRKFTPVLKDIFNAFYECPYDKLKIVIVGQDPYPQIGVADGIAFSCSNSEKEQPSLRYIFDEIEQTVYKPHLPGNKPEISRENYDKDLRRWSRQGILMLNTALTCEINNIGSHVDLWKPFMIHLFDMLNTYNTGIIYVFLGKKAMEWHKNISANNYKFFAPHPASAVYNGTAHWDSGNLFNNINKVMHDLYGEQIIW